MVAALRLRAGPVTPRQARRDRGLRRGDAWLFPACSAHTRSADSNYPELAAEVRGGVW